MTVLVTGGAGYIGSHMVWKLLDAGEDVVVIDRLSTGFRWAVPPAARFYLGDIADEALLQTIFAENRIDAIIHFAGSAVVPTSIEDPLSYYENNTGKTRILMSAAVSAGIRHFVFSSTAAVYGAQPADMPVSETALPRPESPYGQSKLMSELMLRDAAAAYDFSYVALRYFNVAGADPEGRAGQSSQSATHLVKVACEAALGCRHQVNIYGTDYPTHDGTGVRDYIHVSDLAEAHLLALRHLRGGGRSLVANCGYGTGYSVLDVLNMVMRVHGRAFRIHIAPRRPGDAASVIADATLAQRELGWTPKYNSLETIVRSSLDWEIRLAKRAGLDADEPQLILAAQSA
ncbi:UDP-glucose 4-epimerase GalE [Rhizobium sp. BR 314]|uniref:UDP-glucose 4-epimerase GalE n=1 Tax=Rhizobium sp. BR 314 TaxID=3040013 RepID=UPI0039BF7B7D